MRGSMLSMLMGATVREDPLGPGVSDGGSYAGDRVRVVASDRLDDGFSLSSSVGGSAVIRVMLQVGGRGAGEDDGVDGCHKTSLAE